MGRLIDADGLKKSIIKKLGIASEEFLLESEKAVFEEIDKAPTIDAVQVRHGRWIDYTDEGYVECDQCRSATNCDGDIEELNYCWNCGAKMDAQEKEE